MMNECLRRQATKRPTFIDIQSKLNDYFENINRSQERSNTIDY